MLSWSPWISPLLAYWAQQPSAIGVGCRGQVHAPSGVLVGGGRLQCILRRINDEAQILAVSHDLDGGEGNRDVLFADPEKSPDADERGGNGAVGRYDEIADRPDLLAAAIVHAFVEVRTRQ